MYCIVYIFWQSISTSRIELLIWFSHTIWTTTKSHSHLCSGKALNWAQYTHSRQIRIFCQHFKLKNMLDDFEQKWSERIGKHSRTEHIYFKREGADDIDVVRLWYGKIRLWSIRSKQCMNRRIWNDITSVLKMMYCSIIKERARECQLHQTA